MVQGAAPPFMEFALLWQAAWKPTPASQLPEFISTMTYIPAR